MTITFGVVVLWIIFVLCIIYEPRKFINALMLMGNICLTMLAIAMKPGISGAILGAFIMFIPIFIFILAIFLIINGIQMIKKEGHHLSNLLSLLAGIAIILGSIATVLGMYYFQDESIFRSIFYLVLIIELYVSFSFVSFFVYSILYTYIPKQLKCDYIIVLGCGLTNGEKVSPLLRGRVDKAVKVFKKCEDNVKMVVSGGQGSDEKISEAQAMKNYLLEIGFPENKIILEDKSKTTFENLRNVRDMLDTDGKKNKYIFVTSNYHVFRASIFSKKLKMKAVGVGCNTAGYYWPSAFIREYIAILVKYKWIFALIFIMWSLIEIFTHI